MYVCKEKEDGCPKGKGRETQKKGVDREELLAAFSKISISPKKREGERDGGERGREKEKGIREKKKKGEERGKRS